MSKDEIVHSVLIVLNVLIMINAGIATNVQIVRTVMLGSINVNTGVVTAPKDETGNGAIIGIGAVTLGVLTAEIIAVNGIIAHGDAQITVVIGQITARPLVSTFSSGNPDIAATVGPHLGLVSTALATCLIIATKRTRDVSVS